MQAGPSFKGRVRDADIAGVTPRIFRNAGDQHRPSLQKVCGQHPNRPGTSGGPTERRNLTAGIQSAAHNPMKKLLRIDLETYSPADLRKCGVYPYAEHPEFEILLFGYAFDDEPVKVIDLAQGEEIPEDIVEAIFSPDVVKTAYNASFERTCLAAHFGRPTPPEQWRCTSVLALTLGMPGNLAAVSEVCNLAPDKQKMGIGHGLIRYFCIPCKPTKKNGERTRNYPRHDPAKWDLFKLYCTKDVEAERAIYDKLIRWAPNENEQRLWALDQKINDTGMMIDLDLVKAAIGIDDIVKEKLTKEFFELTGITKATQVAKLKKWLEEEHDIETEQLNKEAVKEILKLTDDAKVERAMQLRQMLSKSSVSKYHAMLRAVCADGRVRGLYQFYGANRTGRWAGRIVQTQNLARSDLEHEDLVLARQLVKAYEIDLLELLFGPVQQLLSELIRTAFIAPPGKKLAIVDFSAVEARGLAWGAGEEWRMEVFRTHGKIYEASASEMFKVPLDSIDKKSPLRQKGKISELACIAEGALVLTDEGLVAIENVTDGMRVWDGVEFVSCAGAIFKGVGNVISYDGLTATPDHLVWIEGESRPVQFRVAAAGGSRLSCTGVGRTPVRLGESDISGTAIHTGLERPNDADAVRPVRVGPVVEHGESYPREVEGLPVVLPAASPSPLAGPPHHSDETALREPPGRGVRELWGARDQVSVRFGSGSGHLDSLESWAAQGDGARPEGQQRELRPWESALCDSQGSAVQQANVEAYSSGLRLVGTAKPPLVQYDSTAAWYGADQSADRGACEASGSREEKELARDPGQARTARLYDLLNCGPNNRFTISGKLVHNCGFGGGAGALIAMGGLKMGLHEEELPELIKKWRAANPAVTQFWKDLERHAKQTLRTRIPSGVPGKYRFDYESGFLFMTLPSGRRLAYVKPRLVKEGTFTKITYDGMDQVTKQWGRVDTFGGKICENWDQGACRDILGEALLSLDSAGIPIVGHVHDEAIIEVDEVEPETEYRIAEEIFSRPMPWAPGLPLSGDGFISPFYKK